MNRLLLVSAALLGALGRANAATLGKMTVKPPAPWVRGPGVEGDNPKIVRWRGPKGRELALFFWPGYPPHPGGPAVVSETVPVKVAGRDVTITHLTMFNGLKDDVWAVFLPHGPANYRLHAHRVSRLEFEAIVRTVTFAK